MNGDFDGPDDAPMNPDAIRADEEREREEALRDNAEHLSTDGAAGVSRHEDGSSPELSDSEYADLVRSGAVSNAGVGTFGEGLLEAVKASLNKQIDDTRHQMHCLESDRVRFVAEPGVATFNAYAAGTGYGEDFVVEASGSTMSEALERACSQEHRQANCDWNLDGRIKTIGVSVKLPHTEVSIPFGVYEHSIPIKMLPWAREAAKRQGTK